MKLQLRTIDGIPEALREHAKEVEGGFDLDLPAEWTLEKGVSALRNAYDREKEKARTAAEELKRFEGIDPDQAKADADFRKSGGGKTPKEELDAALEAQKTELTKLFEKEKAPLETRKSVLEREVFNRVVRQDARDALTRAGLPADLLEDKVVGQLRPKEFEETDEQGQKVTRFRSVVTLPDGTPRSGTSDGQPMTVDQLVEEIKDTHGKYIAGIGPSGSGGGGSAGDEGGSPIDDSLSPVEQLKEARRQQAASAAS